MSEEVKVETPKEEVAEVKVDEKKVDEKKKKEEEYYGPKGMKQGEYNYAVCHIYSTFNNTFVVCYPFTLFKQILILFV